MPQLRRQDHRIRNIEDMRERHLLRRLQPVLLIIRRMGRSLDHMERIRKAGLLAPVALRFMQDAPVNDDQIACNPKPCRSVRDRRQQATEYRWEECEW